MYGRDCIYYDGCERAGEEGICGEGCSYYQSEVRGFESGILVPLNFDDLGYCELG